MSSNGLATHLDHEVIVCCGSGGVGKTTTSAALGMALASLQDRRVLILTIDPALRLATALGMSEIGKDPIRIANGRLRRAGIDVRGEVWAAMLDTKSTWDGVVERYSPDQDTARAIKANRFYRSISDAFVGSQEYMAMEALYELHRSGEYDCIVIDTPPSRNALDFIEAPTRVADYVGARLISWLSGGSRFGFRALNFAATPLVRMADRLVGADVLRDLGEFVTLIRTLYGGIQRRGREVYRLLRSPVSAFIVVTTLDPAAFGEAEFFTQKLREYSLPLRGIVVNRVLPELLRDSRAERAATILADDDRIATWLSKECGTVIDAAAVQELGEQFLTYHRLATRDASQLGRLSRLGKAPIVEIPLFHEGVGDLDGLSKITALLLGNNVD